MSDTSKFKGIFNQLFYLVFSYSTVRLLKIHSLKVSIVFKVIQLSILAYIIGWTIIYKKGYQQVDSVTSAVTTKVKGLGFIYDKLENNKKVKVMGQNFFVYDQEGDGYRIFDTADYVIPPSEFNSLFVMTNFVETKQMQDKCPEDYNKVDCICQTDNDCVNVENLNNWDGMTTGKCIPSNLNDTIKVCEIFSWCPVEKDYGDIDNVIQNIDNFTIFIKNDIQFPLFDIKLRNLIPNITNDYISKCAFSNVYDPKCPVFLIGNILRKAEPDPVERNLILKRGAVIQINIEWNCNFDSNKICLPKYSFSRFDLSSTQASAASGFNFRFAEKFEINNVTYRMLVKAYGLRFIIIVNGQGGKFNIIPLMLTIGAGLGLLSLATIVADCMLVTCTKKRQLYKKLKEHDSIEEIKISKEKAKTSNQNTNADNNFDEF